MTTASQTTMESNRRRYFHGLIRFFASVGDKKDVVPAEWTEQYTRALFAAEGLDWVEERYSLEPLYTHLWMLDPKDYHENVLANLRVLLKDLHPQVYSQEYSTRFSASVHYWFSLDSFAAPSVTMTVKVRFDDYDAMIAAHRLHGYPYKEPVPRPKMITSIVFTGLSSEIRKIRKIFDKEMKYRQEQIDALKAKQRLAEIIPPNPLKKPDNPLRKTTA